MIRVAYCFYGQPRKIEEGFAIVQKFMNNNPDILIDFFYHTWFIKNPSGKPYDASPWRQFDRDELLIQPDSIERLNELYRPCGYQVDEPIQFDLTKEQLHESILYKITPGLYIQNLNNTLSQLYSMQQVRGILQQYVNDTGTTYQYVILSRFDFRKEVEIRMNCLTETRLYVSNLQENIKCFCAHYISNYDIFLNISNVFDNLTNLINNTELLDIFKQHNGIDSNLNVETIIAMNYLFYYKHYAQVEFTHLIPNFV